MKKVVRIKNAIITSEKNLFLFNSGAILPQRLKRI